MTEEIRSYHKMLYKALERADKTCLRLLTDKDGNTATYLCSVTLQGGELKIFPLAKMLDGGEGLVEYVVPVPTEEDKQQAEFEKGRPEGLPLTYVMRSASAELQAAFFVTLGLPDGSGNYEWQSARHSITENAWAVAYKHHKENS